MKHIKYLLLVLVALAIASCSKDSTKDPVTPGGSARKAFMALNEIGVYQYNQPLFLFNKATQQLSITPSKRIIRIQSDAGNEYVQLTFAAMPVIGGQNTTGTFKNNVRLPDMTLENLELLRAENDLIWLWCDKNQMGLILPWVE